MIDNCLNNYTNLSGIIDINTTVAVNKIVPENSAIGLESNITITQSSKVQWVGVWFDLSFSDLGEFEFFLTSPSGTTTKLLHYDNALYDNSLVDDTLRLSSWAFVDENSNGIWKIKVAHRDNSGAAHRTINNIKLQIVGY
jgi:subtilisin-like proprotein convertase family protein